MSPEINEKCCQTCVFCEVNGLGATYDFCKRTYHYCSISTKREYFCGPNLKYWQPKHPPVAQETKGLLQKLWEKLSVKPKLA